MIYLDSAASTEMYPEVLDAMLPFMKGARGNAGSVHKAGREARQAVEKAREQTAKLLGCLPGEVVFTSGGTEANNLAISGIASVLLGRGMTHIITSEAEHDSVYMPIRNLLSKGFDVTYLPVTKYGCVNAEDLERAFRRNTGLVSLMYMNNETGACNSVKEICDLVLYAQSNPYCHIDCVQAAGCCFHLNMEEVLADTASVSSHKIGGPQGVGALYIRGLHESSEIQPIITGGAGQEFGIRGGSENVAGIVGFGKACEITEKERSGEMVCSDMLRTYFHRELKKVLKENGMDSLCYINSSSGKIANIRFDGIDAQTLVLALDSRGVCISAGSACHGGSSEPSRTLMASGLTPDQSRNSVRISFHSGLKLRDVAEAARHIADCVKMLKEGI